MARVCEEESGVRRPKTLHNATRQANTYLYGRTMYAYNTVYSMPYVMSYTTCIYTVHCKDSVLFVDILLCRKH